MFDRLAAFVVGEGNWLPLAMAVAALASGALLRAGAAHATHRRRILAAMNLFCGVMLLIMGAGHVLAVTTRLWLGTLVGSAPLFYLIGAAIIAPAACLVLHTRGILAGVGASTTVSLNTWMAVTLAVLGLVNLPLAVPAISTAGYALHERPWVGRAWLALAIVACLGLFIGGVIFMLSGQSFEEFSAGR